MGWACSYDEETFNTYRILVLKPIAKEEIEKIALR
jgi:hypothetical protein